MDTLIVMRKPLKKYSKITNRVRSKQNRAEAEGGLECSGAEACPGRGDVHSFSFVKLYNEVCEHNALSGHPTGRFSRKCASPVASDGHASTSVLASTERRSRVALETATAGEVRGAGDPTTLVFETDYGRTDSRV